MKIALCISGYFRGILKCLPTWDQFLFPGHDFHLFVVTGPTTDWHLNDNTYSIVQQLQNKYKVEEIVTADNVKKPFDPLIIQRTNDVNRNIEHVLSMFHKMEYANQLKINYQIKHNMKFDLTIRWRPDIYLKSKIDLIDNQKLNIPKYGDFGGINDQIAWGNDQIMNQYSQTYSSILNHFNNNPSLTLNPEFLLREQLLPLIHLIERPEVLYQLARDQFNMMPDNKTRENIMAQTNGMRNQ